MTSTASMDSPALTPAAFDKRAWLERVCQSPFMDRRTNAYAGTTLATGREWTRSRLSSMSSPQSTRS